MSKQTQQQLSGQPQMAASPVVAPPTATRADSVEELARGIFLRLVTLPGADSKTPSHLAEKALGYADCFYNIVGRWRAEVSKVDAPGN